MTDLEGNMLAVCRTTLVWLRSLPDELREKACLETILSMVIKDAEIK